MISDSLKFRLTVAFDGTRYAGWQTQKTGTGVQEVLERAIHELFPGAGRVHSSSRTDTGVHALGMVAHIDIPKAQFKMPEAKLVLALNAFLPDDIRVMSARRCPSDFHARFDATGKQYRYFVWNARSMNPLWRHQAWLVPRLLDLPKMRAAAAFFVGRHDFKSLAGTRHYEMESTIRTVWRCEIRKSGSLLVFRIEGDGFLYKMCRAMVGTLVQVGLGRFEPDAVPKILASKDRKIAGMTAPARGLVLWKVFYGKKG